MQEKEFLERDRVKERAPDELWKNEYIGRWSLRKDAIKCHVDEKRTKSLVGEIRPKKIKNRSSIMRLTFSIIKQIVGETMKLLYMQGSLISSLHL